MHLNGWTVLAIAFVAFFLGVALHNSDDDSAKGLAIFLMLLAIIIFAVRITIFFNQ